MRLFILEDYEERTHWFSSVFLLDEMVLCNQAGLAMELLRTVKFDVILLDHDLCGDAYVPSDHPNTGFTVVKGLWTTINRDTPVVVHSHNPEGADRMMDILGARGHRIPFGRISREELLRISGGGT